MVRFCDCLFFLSPCFSSPSFPHSYHSTFHLFFLFGWSLPDPSLFPSIVSLSCQQSQFSEPDILPTHQWHLLPLTFWLKRKWLRLAGGILPELASVPGSLGLSSKTAWYKPSSHSSVNTVHLLCLSLVTSCILCLVHPLWLCFSSFCLSVTSPFCVVTTKFH